MTTDLDARLDAAFAAAFGGAPDLVVRAPGRVNLIGEHTDYNDGFVLPAAISGETRIALRRRPDRRIELVAADFDVARDGFDLDAPIRAGEGPAWADYVRGMIVTMQAEGIDLPGAELAIAGSVPRGAGLSSSASLEVAVGWGMLALAGAKHSDRTQLARMAQAAESDFVGMKCGIMDQLVSARGVAGHALLIDCRSLEVQPIAMPDHLAILIVHSGVKRGLVEGHYNQRRAQCEAAARHFGVVALRDLDAETLEAGRDGLDPVAWRRARHVVSENARTLVASRALIAGDLARLGALMSQSHASMRDDFEITVPEIDMLVSLLQVEIGAEGGARMTGGGFGGAVVALLPAARIDAVREAVAARYRTPDGAPPLMLVERPAAGVGVLA